MSYKEVYMDIKSLINKFNKHDYWHHFTNKDQFYIIDFKEYLVSFTDDLNDDAYGIQLFYNNDGFNYVHERLTTKYEETVNIFECDAIFLKIVPKNNLLEEEIEYLKKMGLRITNNNMLIYRFRQGYKEQLAKINELEVLYHVLEILNSIIPNEFNDITECFKNDDCACVLINENYEYNIYYRPLLLLQRPYHPKPKNKAIIDEFSDKLFVDDEWIIFSTYSPFSILETNVRPLLVYIYFKKARKSLLKYFIGKPNELYDFTMNLIYELFTEYGKPVSIVVNSMKVLSYVEKTLKALNIEITHHKEDEEVSYGLNECVQRLQFNASNNIIETEEGITLMLETVSELIKGLSLEDDDINYDEEYNDEEHYIS